MWERDFLQPDFSQLLYDFSQPDFSQPVFSQPDFSQLPCILPYLWKKGKATFRNYHVFKLKQKNK